ncbi:hypothetical protein ACFZBC_28830 [Streptomyces luteogriseus]|uniref:hypothetical protein n=1 Tax=Streptomyces luteogriseus TaxID=68233 RepID=UPI0036EC71AB
MAGAIVALEELLADDERVLGPDHPDTLTTRLRLSRWRGEAEALGLSGPNEQESLSIPSARPRIRGQVRGVHGRGEHRLGQGPRHARMPSTLRTGGPAGKGTVTRQRPLPIAVPAYRARFRQV